MKVLVIHGPNLNLLGVRQPELYGKVSLEEINSLIQSVANKLKVEVEFFQSNSEAEIINKIQITKADGILINPAGLGHYSVSLLDALLAANKPFVEVHITNPWSRGGIRAQNVLAADAAGRVEGFGATSYLLGFLGLCQKIAGSEIIGRLGFGKSSEVE